jgi:hypothetical protein
MTITINMYKINSKTNTYTFLNTMELESGDNTTWKEHTHPRTGQYGKAFKKGVLEALKKGRAVTEYKEPHEGWFQLEFTIND